MNKAHLIGAAVGFLLLIVFFGWDILRQERPVQASEPLVGTLYRGEITELSQADKPFPAPVILTARQSVIPQIVVSQTNLTELGFSVSTGPYVVNVIAGSEAPFQLVPQPGRKAKTSQPKTRLVSGEVHASSSTTQENVGGVPIKPYDFKFLNTLLETSDSTCLLHGRYQKGDFILELDKLLKWYGLYLMQLGISNEGGREIFISNVRVMANGSAIKIQPYLPFSCRPGEKEAGIVTFPVSDVKGKMVGVQLAESGGKGAVLEIKNVDYPF